MPDDRRHRAAQTCSSSYSRNAAGVSDLETLLRVAAGRLRWVVDFDRCTFALTREEGRVCWTATRTEEAVCRAGLAEVPEAERTLVERVLDSGAPAALPPRAIGLPIQVAGRTFGALCFSIDAGAYTYRDMRLAHHAGQYLGFAHLADGPGRRDAPSPQQAKGRSSRAALLGHELRNPLAPIVTAVHVLKGRAHEGPSKELDVIERQAQHLVRLVDDLLDVARLTRGKMVLQRGPVEVAQVIARAVEMVSPLLEQRRHALAIDVPPTGLIVDADENRLAQVVS